MIFTLNGKEESAAGPLSLEALVAVRQLCPARIVLEHNLCIIPKEDWPKIMLRENDRVEIISFVGGG